MNLEEKLNNSLNDILKSSGYIFEIIHSRKKQSNLITGPNNQLITPVITSQLTHSITKFEDILDDTICKFNDTKWCVEQMLQNRQKQEELKLKEEEEKQRRIKEDDERKRLEEEEAKKRKKEEEEAARIKKEKEEQQAKEEELKKKKEQEQKEKEQKERESRIQNEKKTETNNDNFDTFMSPSFEFNLNDLPTTNERGMDIPNPSDILSTISYDGFSESKDPKNPDTNFPNNESNNNNNDLDLDMNNLLDNDALLLDGLDMNMLDQGFDGNNTNGNGVNNLQDEEFDVDNFLNQFGAD
ncbi:uncharacterized protein AC631_03336 [Debaryomyces fabryi]|uniref:Mediator complex subunit 2 n=1 Tax=Debaryomyces fabryi TaxID=58627 RepID=A0A0V1PXS7_9ASCO|nr:uncharacterized protein AC631_03336 [Debaryomyces fabryi]KSA00906.1 hypothetical protein AC631_03336 [Debaryomyces fabryi]CUM51802.1 unnamed protein product [Debaryomyces fabryi]